MSHQSSRYLIAALLSAASMTVSTDAVQARRGADDPAGHVRQCRRCDDLVPHASTTLRRDDSASDKADDRGQNRGSGKGGHGADDPVGHDVGDDHGR